MYSGYSVHTVPTQMLPYQLLIILIKTVISGAHIQSYITLKKKVKSNHYSVSRKCEGKKILPSISGFLLDCCTITCNHF